MISWATVRKEVKIHLRNAWTFAFVIIFSIFTLGILYLTNHAVALGQYTRATSILMNLIAYFIPLLSLVTGAFSLTMEKEDGSWLLLLTYPISLVEWMLGKFLGICVVLFIIVTCAFSMGGLLMSVMFQPLSFSNMVLLYLYTLCLVSLFLAIAVLIGVVSQNRWQALILSVGVWILFVLAWPVLLMSTLHSLPFKISLQALQIATLINPLEFTRIFFTIKLGGGHVFGPQYMHWVSWVHQSNSHVYFIGFSLLWMIILIGCALLMERRKIHRG